MKEQVLIITLFNIKSIIFQNKKNITEKIYLSNTAEINSLRSAVVAIAQKTNYTPQDH